MKSSGIGGQAVLEGVMMKNKSKYAVAVRKPDGTIHVEKGNCKSAQDRALFFRVPIIRGIVAFVDSLVLGIKTLTVSASFYEEEDTKKGSEKQSEKNLKDSGKDGQAMETVEAVLTVLLSVLLAVGFFIILPFFLSNILQAHIASRSVLALFEGVIRIALFVGYVMGISLMSDIKRVFMYHGAEHKSINCVENGYPLTVENVRRQSKHHKRCGTSFLLIVMFLSIIFFMVLHFNNVWLRLFLRILLVPVIAGVSYEFILFAGNSDNVIVNVLSQPGIWLQRLTTREPDDAMIEVAIASVEAVFDWEAYQSRQKALKTVEKAGWHTDNKREKRAKEREERRERKAWNAQQNQERKAGQKAALTEEAEKQDSEAARQKTAERQDDAAVGQKKSERRGDAAVGQKKSERRGDAAVGQKKAERQGDAAVRQKKAERQGDAAARQKKAEREQTKDVAPIAESKQRATQIAATESVLKPDKPKKVFRTRAERREALARREAENRNRANERARRIKEQEQREAELEEIANKALKNKAARHAMQIEKEEDDEILSKLDFYFDDEAASSKGKE